MSVTTGPFVVHVTRLRRSVGTRWHEVRSGRIDDLTVTASGVPDGSDVQADVVLESVLGGVSVTGTVRAPWKGTCGRCLTPVDGVLELPVLQHYTEDGDGEDTYPLRDSEVDLEPLVRDAVLLELPAAPLCRPDCLGLCPWCGANRNDEACDCQPPADERWSALDALRDETPDTQPGETVP